MSKISKFANKFAFFAYLRFQREAIVAGFRKWVENYGMENMKETIRKGEYPAVAPDLFAQAGDYMDFVQEISVDYLAELIAEALPEIAEYLIRMGPEGGIYIVKLREHFLDLCRHPEQAPAAAMAGTAESEYVKVTCDKCGKSTSVKKSDLEKMEKCPFCGDPAR